jgi:hypothetical protein
VIYQQIVAQGAMPLACRGEGDKQDQCGHRRQLLEIQSSVKPHTYEKTFTEV